MPVALLTESVDRNCTIPELGYKATVSLSSRRAWIEMAIKDFGLVFDSQSLSSRRAWIEILF